MSKWIWDEAMEKDTVEALTENDEFEFSEEDFTFFLHVNYKAKQKNEN